MSTRSYNNPRNLKGAKGATRKSAGKAKPKAKAASSVYVTSAAAKEKSKKSDRKREKEQQRQEEREAENVLNTYLKKDEKYNRWHKIFIILIVIAVVFVLFSWITGMLVEEGKPLAAFAEQKSLITYIGMGAGYSALIGALIIDFAVIRKQRKKASANYDEIKKDMEKEEAAKKREAREAFANKQEYTQASQKKHSPLSAVKDFFK